MIFKLNFKTVVIDKETIWFIIRKDNQQYGGALFLYETHFS